MLERIYAHISQWVVNRCDMSKRGLELSGGRD